MGTKQNNKKTGALGETIAADYLKKQGFRILERNYYRRWGEIDIVASQNKKSSVSQETVHFIEVKSVSYETKSLLEWAVAHETWRPEELVHQFKLNQIRKAVESWVVENNWLGNIQLDVIAVRMVPREKYATIKYIDNVIISD